MATSTAIFRTPDMSCLHCVKAIKSALQSIAGVTGVDVDLGGKLVTVTYDGTLVTPAALTAALAAAGYPVSG